MLGSKFHLKLPVGTNEPLYRTEVESQMEKTNSGYQGGRQVGMNWETEIDVQTAACKVGN